MISQDENWSGIGGSDHHIECYNPYKLALKAIALSKQIWPDHVLEIDGSKDIFIYKNKEAFDNWQELGMSDKTQDTLIYLIINDGSLSVSLDDIPNAELKEFLDKVRLIQYKI